MVDLVLVFPSHAFTHTIQTFRNSAEEIMRWKRPHNLPADLHRLNYIFSFQVCDQTALLTCAYCTPSHLQFHFPASEFLCCHPSYLNFPAHVPLYFQPLSPHLPNSYSLCLQLAFFALTTNSSLNSFGFQL